MKLRITVDQFSESLTQEKGSLYDEMFNATSNENLELSRQLAERIINMIADEGEKYDPVEWILAMAFCIDMMFEYMHEIISPHAEHESGTTDD